MTDTTPTDDAGLTALAAEAVAAYLGGRESASFAAWEHGYRRCTDAGDTIAAARFGIHLAQALAFKGDIARASGWVERLRHQLDAADAECVEVGYIEHLAAFCRIMESGDVGSARAGFERAIKVADRFVDRELLTLGRIGAGRCLIYSGDLSGGLALLDEAMVSVEMGELTPVVVGDAYCTVIDACHEVFDLRRCETWSASFTRWCDANPDVVLYRGQCLLHRAELLALRGAWADALAAVREACARLAEPVNYLTIGGAHRLEADVHRLRGDHGSAEAAYARADEAGCSPQPGRALLRVAQGQVDVAAGMMRRALMEADNPFTRARLLGPAVEIFVARGELDIARQLCAELDGIARELASPWLAAHAAHVNGAVKLADGDTNGALSMLRRAWTGWCELDAPYEGALTRLLLASVCDAIDDLDGATSERAAAENTLRSLAFPAPMLSDSTTAPGGTTGGLTAREVEVLQLVARGHTNREIGVELFIAEKTVASHLNHIFTKLGLSSRSAATAYAYDHGMV